MLKNTKKLMELGWDISEGCLGIEDDDTVLMKKFNLSATISSGDYSSYGFNGIIVDNFWIKYNIYLNKETCTYITWMGEKNEAKAIPIIDDYYNVLREAVADTLFCEIDFPKLNIIINSDTKTRTNWYDLVQLETDYENSLSNRYEKGDYFIHFINNCNEQDYSLYYNISTKQAESIIDKKDIEDAINEMEEIVRKFV